EGARQAGRLARRLEALAGRRGSSEVELSLQANLVRGGRGVVDGGKVEVVGRHLEVVPLKVPAHGAPDFVATDERRVRRRQCAQLTVARRRLQVIGPQVAGLREEAPARARELGHLLVVDGRRVRGAIRLAVEELTEPKKASILDGQVGREVRVVEGRSREGVGGGAARADGLEVLGGGYSEREAEALAAVEGAFDIGIERAEWTRPQTG